MAALLCYTMWGVFPVYFKIVDEVPALEVLAHRIVWAVPVGAVIIGLRRQWREVLGALAGARTLALLALAALFIAVNWLVYIEAVQRSEIFQASLGYYINPLMYVLIGVLFFGERLRGFQVAAVALAAAGVTVLTVSGGEFPAIAMFLAMSFTVYGVIRKRVAVAAMPGLFIETLVLSPLALAYLAWLVSADAAAFAAGRPLLDGLLLLAGPLTVLPLLLFAVAARRLALSTVGFLQFIAPTLQFVVGLVYGEPLTLPHAICFGLIWSAVALFVYGTWRGTPARAG